MSQWFMGLSLAAIFAALLTSSCVTKSTYVADAGPDALAEDAGSDTTPLADAADTCAPRDVTNFKPSAWTPPTRFYQGKCTDKQLTEVLACYFGTSAKPANCDQISNDPAYSDCAACLFTPEGVQAGPLVVDDRAARLNVPGCIATFDGNVTEGGCGAKYKAAAECARAACLENCPGDDAEAVKARGACATKALETVCKSYATEAACADTLVGPGGKAEECLEGEDFIESAIVLGRLFCGRSANDGGAGDAS